MKQYFGFILPTIFIFMQIYVLLGMTAMDQVFLTQKWLSDQKARRLLINEAESLLRQLTLSLNEVKERCLIPVLPVHQLRSYPLKWWYSHACTRKGTVFRSYYIVEALGQDACAQLREEKPAQAAYYRLTVLLIKEHDETTKVMLQRTLVMSSHDVEPCEGKPHFVDWGPQTWYELI